MGSLNKVQLIGNLGKDPELKTLESGKQVARFTIATSEKYNGNETTEWHNCEAWGPTADLVAKYLTKGTGVYVEGKIRTRQYQDKDGATKYATDIVVFNLVFLPGGKADGSKPAPKATEAVQVSDQTDDLPF